jgi:hypothetical protein
MVFLQKKLNTSAVQKFLESLNYDTNIVLESKTRNSCGSGILAAICDTGSISALLMGSHSHDKGGSGGQALPKFTRRVKNMRPAHVFAQKLFKYNKFKLL